MTVARITERDLDYIETRFRDIFLTRDEFVEFKSEITDMLVDILKEVKDFRDEFRILNRRVNQHEDRIVKLENPSLS